MEDEVTFQEQYIPLLRNHNYVVTVTEITENGFEEPELAFRSQRYGLDYTVQSWSEHDFDIEGGIYRLDISATSLAFNQSSNTASVTITTTHPDGWMYKVSNSATDPDAGSPGWITNLQLDNPPVQYATVEFSFDISVNTSGLRYAYIHIVSGNLTNVITVMQSGGGGGSD